MDKDRVFLFRIDIRTPKLSDYKPRGVTKRRLYHANKYIEKQKEKAGLFAEEFCKDLDPIKRIMDRDEQTLQLLKDLRKREAKNYWDAKKQIANLSLKDKKDFFEWWDNLHLKKVEFALDALYQLAIDKYHLERQLGKRTSYTKTVINTDGSIEIVELSKDEYFNDHLK